MVLVVLGSAVCRRPRHCLSRRAPGHSTRAPNFELIERATAIHCFANAKPLSMSEREAVAFVGYWKITKMEVWSQKYVDLIVPGFIELAIAEERLTGSFQFGTIVGWLDCRLRTTDDSTAIEWSWDGRNDADPSSGRGWAALVDGELVGRIFIHGGDDSAFKARRQIRPTTLLESSRTRRSGKSQDSRPN